MQTRFTLAALVALALPLSAQNLLLPSTATPTTDAPGSTSYPFNRTSATPTSNDIRVQDRYDTTNFAGQPVVVTALRFRANETTSSWTGGVYSNVLVRVGACANDYQTLSTTFAANWPGGVEPAPAYAGPVTVVPGTGNGLNVAGPYFIDITLTTPVVYDPTAGNDFLVDLMHDGTWTGGTSVSHDSGGSTGAGSRMYNISDWQAATGTFQAASKIVIQLVCTPGSLTQLGGGCPNSTGSTAMLAAGGGNLPAIGSTFTFALSNAPANQALSFVVVGFASLGGVDLGLIGMPGCALFPDPLVSLAAGTNGTGSAEAVLGIPNVQTTIGLVFYGQAFVADPGHNAFGAVLSGAVRGSIGGC